MNSHALLRLCLLAGALGGLACKQGVNQKRDVHGFLAMHQAASAGDLEAMKRLFEAGADPNAVDLDGVTPLHRAARNNQLDVQRLLLEHYADATLRTNPGWDAVHLAVWNEHPESLKLLLSFGAIANQATPEGLTPLHMAARRNSAVMVETLLLEWDSYKHAGKPDVNAKDSKANTPLHIALQRGYDVVANTLLLKGADPNLRDENGDAALHLLPGTPCGRLALNMISAGANVNEPNRADKTPFQIAVEKGDQTTARVIWEHGGR